MPNTAITKSEIKRRYAILRRRQNFAGILATAGVIILIFLRVTGSDESDWLPTVWRPVALLVFLWLIVFSLFNWRCHPCNAFLGKFSFKHCSNCGIELR